VLTFSAGLADLALDFRTVGYYQDHDSVVFGFPAATLGVASLLITAAISFGTPGSLLSAAVSCCQLLSAAVSCCQLQWIL